MLEKPCCKGYLTLTESIIVFILLLINILDTLILIAKIYKRSRGRRGMHINQNKTITAKRYN